MSTEQQENLDAILRQSAFPVGSSVDEQRRALRELLSAQPLPADVTVTEAALGGVPTAEVTAVAAAPVIEKYLGVLAAADVYTESTTFWVMESIRLDLGYGSQVHS